MPHAELSVPGPLAVLAARGPDMSAAEAEATVLATYGILARATPLASERDQNLLMTAADGRRTVFKLCNAAQDEAVARFQVRALQHVAAVEPDLPVPRVLPTVSGDPLFRWRDASGSIHTGWLASYLSGVPMAERPRTEIQAARFGTLAARLGRALRGFSDPASEHDLLWDLRHAPHVADLLRFVPEERDRTLAAAALERFRDHVLPRLAGLRRQVIHNDLNPHNVLVDPDRPDEPCGIIDFGDMVSGALVGDVAVAAAYLVAADADPLALVRRFVAAYHAEVPLEREEIEILPDLVATRHAMTCAIAAWRAERYPDNAAYIRRNLAAAVLGLETLAALDRATVEARLLSRCGQDGRP